MVRLLTLVNLVNLASETSKATQIPLLSSSGLRDVFCLSYCGASSTQILCACVSLFIGCCGFHFQLSLTIVFLEVVHYCVYDTLK